MVAGPRPSGHSVVGESVEDVSRPGFLDACRVRHWVHFLVLPLAGMQASVDLDERFVAACRGVLIAGCVLAFGYLLNGVADRHMDDRQKNPLSEAPERRWGVILGGLAFTSLGLAATGPWVTFAATTLVLLSGLVYSVGPRLKRYPIVGTLTNATNFTPLLWVGLPASGATSGTVVLTQAFILLLVQNQLFHEAADRHEDLRGGVSTSYACFGRTRCAIAVGLLGVLLTGMCMLEGFEILGISAALVFGLWATAAMGWRGDDVTQMARARGLHRLASILFGAWLFAATLS